MNQYIHFEIAEEKPKTNSYKVLTNRLVIESGVTPHPIQLGVIEWSPQWRQYAFFPSDETVWNNGCLTEILNFLNQLKTNKKLVPSNSLQENRIK
jgi:hypothetical protein